MQRARAPRPLHHSGRFHALSVGGRSRADRCRRGGLLAGRPRHMEPRGPPSSRELTELLRAWNDETSAPSNRWSHSPTTSSTAWRCVRSQATALVNEVCLRMLGWNPEVSERNCRAGEPGRSRTFNQQIKSLLLCQLSYRSIGRGVPETGIHGGIAAAATAKDHNTTGLADQFPLLVARISQGRES
jgi:hypothetical protein